MGGTASSILLWPLDRREHSNSLLGQIFVVYGNLHGIPKDVEFGDVFSRIDDNTIRFMVENSPSISSTIGGSFECHLSRSPVCGSWYGAIVMHGTVGAVMPLPTCGEWYVVARDSSIDMSALYYTVLAELVWIGFEDPHISDVIQIGREAVLISPRALHALDLRRAETAVVNALQDISVPRTTGVHRRVVVDWTFRNDVPIVPWLRVAKYDGTGDMFVCVHVGPDGNRL